MNTANYNEQPSDESFFNAGSESDDDLSDDGTAYSNIGLFNESDSDPEVDNIADDTPLDTKIAEFTLRHNITHRVLADLLAILKSSSWTANRP